MTLQQSSREFAVKARSARMKRFLALPGWYLRLRLRWTQHGIDRIERQLDGEFGVLETAPLHDELAALVAERDALSRRLIEQT